MKFSLIVVGPMDSQHKCNTGLLLLASIIIVMALHKGC